MNDRMLISQALLDLAKTSETTFLDNSKIDNEIVDAAKKVGIVLPSPDFAVFATTYAEIDKVNKNGVVLPRKAVEKGLQTLIGKQLNWEHDGKGFVCGYTIAAKINEDKIQTINVLFKSLFPDKIDELKEKIKTKEAAVSFEIWNKDPNTGDSVVKMLDNGFREISRIIFHGTGVLLVNPPACPNAKIFKLIAKKEIEEADSKVFAEDLIFATLAIEEPSCKNCVNCNCKKEEQTVKLEENSVTANDEAKVEETKEVHIENSSEETKTEEAKVEETKPVEGAETKTTEEQKVEETKEDVVAEEKKVEVVESKIVVKVISVESYVTEDTYIDGTPSGTNSQKCYRKKVTEYSDGTKDEIEEEIVAEKKYSFAEVEARVAEAVAQAKEEITKAKDAEIVALKENNEKELLAKTQELEKTSQELAIFKANEEKKVEEKSQSDLNVGNAESTKTDVVIERRKKINLKAYGHDNQGW